MHFFDLLAINVYFCTSSSCALLLGTQKKKPTTLDIEIYCHDKLCRAGKNDEIHLNTEKRHKN